MRNSIRRWKEWHLGYSVPRIQKKHEDLSGRSSTWVNFHDSDSAGQITMCQCPLVGLIDILPRSLCACWLPYIALIHLNFKILYRNKRLADWINETHNEIFSTIFREDKIRGFSKNGFVNLNFYSSLLFKLREVAMFCNFNAVFYILFTDSARVSLPSPLIIFRPLPVSPSKE